jgi:hypothetical protein
MKLAEKIFSYLLTGSFSVVFAACYGPPMNLENPKQINAKNGDNEAIPGLKVTLYENREAIDEQFTNELGSVEFFIAQKDKYIYTAKIEDVDGADNLGEFKSKELDLTNESFIEVYLDNLNK